jgi:hypothetical protein
VSPNRKLYSFWIDPAAAERLKTIKARTGTSESDQIRAAINDWLDRNSRSGSRRKAVKPKKS